MINSVTIKDNTRTPIHYVSDISALSNGRSFNFYPGINIIVGPNGSGKSTLLKLIEKYLLIDKDVQDVKYVRELIANQYKIEEEPKLYDGVDVHSDYALTSFRYCHMNELQMEDDRAMSSFANFQSLYTSMHSSTGESVLVSLERLFGRMFSHDTDLKFPIQKIKDLSNEDSAYGKYARLYKDYVKNHLVEYKSGETEFTILMDEPDRNLDVTNINEIYPILCNRKPDTQIVAVIHNPLLIYKLQKNSKDIHWIEMEEGYINKIKEEIDKIVK